MKWNEILLILQTCLQFYIERFRKTYKGSDFYKYHPSFKYHPSISMGELIWENAIFAFAVNTFLKNSTCIKILYFTKICKIHKV